MPLFVHAVGTTGLHTRARRRHVYDSHCAQCGVLLNQSSHVAAHVVRYECPFCVPNLGVLTLTTTCRSCNSQHQKAEENEACCLPKARFWKHPFYKKTVFLNRVRRFWCWRYNARISSECGESVQSQKCREETQEQQ